MRVKIKPNFFIIPFIAFSVAITGRFFVDHGMQWYSTMRELLVIPPQWIMDFLSDIVDIISTATIFIIWNQFKRNRRFWLIVLLFFINAFFNSYWHYLVFYQQELNFALIVALLIELTVLFLIFLIWPESKKTALLLIPYASWAMMILGLNIIILFET
jgi:translocator protein